MGYQVTWFNKPYLVIRFCLWTLLAIVSFGNALKHCGGSKRNGYQLHRCLSVVLGVYLLREVFTVAWISDSGGKSAIEEEEDNIKLYGCLIFLYDFADSLFLGLLLLISNGYCVISETLQNKKPIIFFPTLHFLSTLIQDFILESNVGHSDKKELSQETLSGTQKNLLVFVSFISLICFFGIWYWVAVSLGVSRKYLIEKLQRAHTEDDGESNNTDNENQAFNNNDQRPLQDEFEAIDLDADSYHPEGTNVEVERLNTSDMSHNESKNNLSNVEDSESEQEDADLESQIDDADDDEIDEETAIPLRAKLKLFNQFLYAVQAYMLGVIASLVITIMFSVSNNEVGEDRGAPKSLIAVEIMGLFFMASLCYIFRHRPHNPYFLVQDFSTSYQDLLSAEERNQIGQDEEDTVEMTSLPVHNTTVSSSSA